MGKKSYTINNWKRRGLKDDYEKIYDIVMNTTKCNLCDKVFDCDRNRCMDHDHKTGKFRLVLCRSCNNAYNKKRQSIQKSNTSGFINICKEKNGWRFSREHQGVRCRKYFKNKIDCMCYKIIFILKNKIKYREVIYKDIINE
jgi:hypothetical protein